MTTIGFDYRHHLTAFTVRQITFITICGNSNETVVAVGSSTSSSAVTAGVTISPFKENSSPSSNHLQYLHTEPCLPAAARLRSQQSPPLADFR